MLVAEGGQLVEGALPGVAEGGVPQIVPQGDGLGQVLVEAQAPGNGAGDLRHLQGVGEPGAVVVALGGEEDLGLVLEPPEGLAVQDPVPVPGVGGADPVLRGGGAPAPALLRQGGVGGQGLPLDPLGHLANGHLHSPLYLYIRQLPGGFLLSGNLFLQIFLPPRRPSP